MIDSFSLKKLSLQDSKGEIQPHEDRAKTSLSDSSSKSGPLRVLAIAGRPLDSLGGAERSFSRVCEALAHRTDVQILAPTSVIGTPTSGPSYKGSLLDSVLGKLDAAGQVDIVYFGSHFLLKIPTALERIRARFPTAKLVLKETTAGKLLRLLSRLHTQEACQVVQALNAIVCTSQRIYHDYESLPGFKGRLELIPNGVDTRLFSPVPAGAQTMIRKRLGLDIDRPLVLYVGRFAEKKNLDVIYGAWLDMEKNFGDWAQLALVGAVHKHYDEGIIRLMREDLHHVRFAGPFKKDEELALWYQAADFFLAPTSREGFSNAFLEASSCGLFPVVTAISGYEDVITTPQLGMLVEERNTSDVIRCLNTLRQDPATFRRYGRDSLRPQIVAGYDIRLVAQAYQNLFAGLCQGS